MSRVRSRCPRLLLGVGVLLAGSCFAVQLVQARDGRSRTPPAAIEDLPGPSPHAHRGVIVDIAPLHPLDESPSTTAAAPPTPTEPPERPSEIAGFSKQPTRLSEGEAEKIESVKKTLAGFSTGAAPPQARSTVDSPTSNDVKPAGQASDDKVKQTPPSAKNLSIVLVPTASRDPANLFKPESTSAAMLSLDFDVKPTFTFVEAGASFFDETGQSIDPLLAGLSTSRPLVGEVAAAQSPEQRASSLALSESSVKADASSHDVIASTPYLIVPRREARGSKGAPALSAFARDVQLVSNAMPQIQVPKLAEQEAKLAFSGVQRPWESGRTGFQLPSSLPSKPAAAAADAQAAAPASESEAKASDPSTEGDDQYARKAEQERKSQLWQRVAKAQAASKAKALKEQQQEPESARQFKFLRVIKKLMHSQPETPEERNYASLLDEGVRGPMRLRIADRATLWLPVGYVFLDAEKARDLMDGEEGVLDEANFGVILPSTRIPTWMAYVDLIDQGHIRDDDAKALEPKALLAGLTTASAAQNTERARNGVAPLTVSDWVTAPKYLAARHTLNSCVSAIDGASLDPEARLVNCVSLALGRHGAIKILVAGELSNLPSFQSEAAAVAEKITYDQAAGYERFVPDEDKDAGYGLVALASGIVELKNIVAPVAAAGAGKAQDLLLFKILGYWEAILTALIATALGVRWFLVNRLEDEEEGQGSRYAVRMPPWKAAFWAVRSSLRRAFEKEAAPTRVVGAEPEATEKQPNSPQTLARRKSGFSAWREKLASVLSLVRSRGSRPSEAEAEFEAEALSRDERLDGVDGKQATTAAPDRTTSISALRRLRREQDAAASPPQEKSPSAASETSAAPADTAVPSAGSLNRLASLMRKKAEELTPPADASRLPPRRNVRAPTEAASNPYAEDNSGAEAKSPALDLFDLVEPGDAEAVSMAVSAREALQRAHG